MYGVVFLLLHIVGSLAQREFGDAGFFVVSAIGGLMAIAGLVGVPVWSGVHPMVARWSP